MQVNNKAYGLIPARYQSSRFPGKSLALIKGKPMILWVCEQAARAKTLSGIIVATDDERIEKTCENAGFQTFRSKKEHFSGTDRIIEASHALPASIIVNIQGDEPLITPEMIDNAVKPLQINPNSSFQVVTLVKKISDTKEISDPNVVKALLNKNSEALYFSRLPVPAIFNNGALQSLPENLSSEFPFYKHIGLYAFRRHFLKEFQSLPDSKYETLEKLEQLRILENGYSIKCIEIYDDTVGVDTPQDLEKVTQMLEKRLFKT